MDFARWVTRYVDPRTEHKPTFLRGERLNFVHSVLPSIVPKLFGAIGQLLIVASLVTPQVHAQVTVTEVRVMDINDIGVKSAIFEITRERKELPVDDTDEKGIFSKRFVCQEWHKLIAKPLTGSYSPSDYASCETKMILRVWNVKNHPERAMTLIVPFAAASTPGMLALVIAPKLSENWGQQVVIDNRSGAAGIAGTKVAADAAPNGYTLLLGTSPIFTTYPNLYSRLRYDPAKDFAAVTMAVTVPSFLVVTRTLPVQSVKELLQLANSKPGELRFASFGRGSTSHLSGEFFRDLTGARILHIPYKGATPALTHLLSGEAQMSFTSSPVVLSRIKSGELKALGVTGAKRSALFPDVPTIAEAGVPGYELNSWVGVFTPAGTPPQIIRKLNTEIAKVLSTPDVQAKLLSQGLEPVRSTPEQFAAAIEADTSRWTKAVKASGVRLD